MAEIPIDGTPRARASLCYAFPSVTTVVPAAEYVFYDGHCGLCHRTVQFVLRHDPSGKAFRFAPLQGQTFERRVPPSQRIGLPDSIIVQISDGRVLVRSNAILHVFHTLGGGWKLLAGALAIVPRSVRDAAYNFIARIRYFVFGTRDEVCPLVPPDLRARFDP